MKKFMLVTLLLMLSNCSSASIKLSDNKTDFDRVKSLYDNQISSYQYKYDDLFENKLSEDRHASFLFGNRFTDEDYYQKEFDIFQTELPLAIAETKQYIFVKNVKYFMSWTLSGNSSMYMSNDLANKFNTFINNTSFYKQNVDTYSVLATIEEVDKTYYVYDNGKIGLEYSDGFHVSEKTFDLDSIFLECLSVSSYINDNSYQLFEHPIILEYDNESVPVDSLYKFFNKNQCYVSYLINTKEINYEKAIKITNQNPNQDGDSVYWLSSDGIIVREIPHHFFQYGDSVSLDFFVYSFTGGLQYYNYFFDINMEAISELFNS